MAGMHFLIIKHAPLPNYTPGPLPPLGHRGLSSSPPPSSHHGDRSNPIRGLPTRPTGITPPRLIISSPPLSIVRLCARVIPPGSSPLISLRLCTRRTSLEAPEGCALYRYAGIIMIIM